MAIVFLGVGSNLGARQANIDKAVALLKAKEDAPKPGPDTGALEAKTRELQAVLTELEAARQFGRKVEDTLNQVNDEKSRVAAELEAARQFGRKVEDTLNKVNDEKARVSCIVINPCCSNTCETCLPFLSFA